MKNSHTCFAMFIGIAALTQPVFAAEEDGSGAQRCIPISHIRRTEVIDDQNIRFYLHNGKAYSNTLPTRCTGLKMANAFKYATSQSQLCNTDIISVLGQTTGEVVPGATCGLGSFTPIDVKKKTASN